MRDSDCQKPSNQDEKAEAFFIEVLTAAAGTAPLPPSDVPAAPLSHRGGSADLPAAVSVRPPVAGVLDGGSGAPARAAPRPFPFHGTPLSPSLARSAALPPPQCALNRNFGQVMIRMHQSALATVASELNQLWAGCKRVSCAMYDVEAYDSVGSCEPAKLVVTQSKCQRVLEDNAAGVAKATGQRDLSLPNYQGRIMEERMVLKATTETDVYKSMMLGSLFSMSLFLKAQGAKTRGLEVSDRAIKLFPSMFCVGGDNIDVLCSYMKATTTVEGSVYNLGSIGHTEE